MQRSRLQLATAFHRWFHRPLGRRFIQALVVLLTLQGLPLPELSRYYRWQSPLSLAWLSALPAAGGAGVETLIRTLPDLELGALVSHLFSADREERGPPLVSVGH